MWTFQRLVQTSGGAWEARPARSGAVGREAAGRDEQMGVGVIREAPGPCVEDGEDAEPAADPLRVVGEALGGCDRLTELSLCATASERVEPEGTPRHAAQNRQRIPGIGWWTECPRPLAAVS